MKTILTIVGARPQFIKAAVVSRAIKEHNKSETNKIQEMIIHTGQHFDANMSDLFFEEMHIPKPNWNLKISGGTHGQMTGEMLKGIEKIILEVKPDWLLVYGDTNSTLAGALAASKLQIPIAHVEAGLRSFNMNMPEEINRILTDRISNLLFCPTITAVKNLKTEGYDYLPNKIINSGDVMYDAALYYQEFSKKPNSLKFDNEVFILATVHRAENTDDSQKLCEIFDSLQIIAKKTTVVIPLHPRTKKCLDSISYKITSQNLIIIEPVGYLEMIWMLENSTLVMTDSGGLQKEAYFFKKPCITLRDETEWVELIDEGYNLLCGSKQSRILAGYEQMKNIKIEHSGLYGLGDTGNKIVSYLI